MRTLIKNLGISLIALAMPVVAAAQDVIPEAQNTILGQSGTALGGIKGIIVTIANWMFIILLVLAVLWIIVAAYKYLFSGGSEEAVGAAHKMIIYAAIAIAVAMLSKGIVFVVQELVTNGNTAAVNAGTGLGGGGGSNGGINANINLQTKYGNVQINPNIKF